MSRRHRWLLKHSRFHLHFIPTHSSWLNLVERWFGLLTERQIKRGAHTSVRQLQRAIEEFLQVSNAAPKPFVWTKTADAILDKVARYGWWVICASHSYPESDAPVGRPGPWPQ